MTKYESITDLLSGEEGIKRLKDELNEFPLYRALVTACGYSKVGLKILDENKRTIIEYTAHNNKQGEITDIFKDEPANKSGYIRIGIKEKEILKIIESPEEAKKDAERDPRYAVKKYFSGVQISIWQKLKLIAKIPKVMKEIHQQKY